MEHSFHGRSMGALSVTGNAHYREAFQPGIGNVVFAEFNNLEDVKSKITDKTCAIIFEAVQGEGGIYPADKEFIQGIRKICDEKDILLILDEVQCGMGRTGKMFAYPQKHWGAVSRWEPLLSEKKRKRRWNRGTMAPPMEEIHL